MKPLVFWCRWHDAKLRLHGRDDSAVWGQLAFPDETRPFHFNLENWQLTIGEGEERELVQLDEMGVEVKDET